MEIRSLNDLEYDLELDRVAREIKAKKAKRVLIQLPDGLKPFASSIAEAIKEKTGAKSRDKPEIFIYFGTCFGACDVPVEEAKSADINLIVQFGHSPWNFGK